MRSGGASSAWDSRRSDGMSRSWTFGQKVGLGFGAMVALAVTIGAIGIYALRAVAAAKDRVIAVNSQDLIDARTVLAGVEKKSAAARAFILTGEDKFVTTMTAARNEIAGAIERLRARVDTDEGRRLVDEIERARATNQAALESVLAESRNKPPLETMIRLFDQQVPTREALDQ